MIEVLQCPRRAGTLISDQGSKWPETFTAILPSLITWPDDPSKKAEGIELCSIYTKVNTYL
jgi:hypothetical protein